MDTDAIIVNKLSGGVDLPVRREEAAQEAAPDAEPQLLLHGCEVPRMLQNHRGL